MKTTKTKVPDWRAAADPDDLREYDAFGPWVDKIRSEVDTPRRFRGSYAELSGARYLLKVPRPLERAKVRPGMDLYESMIAVFPDHVTVLRADPAEVVRRDIDRDQLAATVRYSNMLLATWRLLLTDGSAVAVDYNSVSHAIIAEVDEYLMASDNEADAAWQPPPGVRPENHLFQSLMGAMNAAARDRLHPVHIEEQGQPCRDARGRRRRSAGMMILASNHDLVIFNRDMATRPRFRMANYAYNIVRAPFRLMTSYELRTSQEQTSPPGFSDLAISSNDQVILQPYLTELTAVEDLFRHHGIPRR